MYSRILDRHAGGITPHNVRLGFEREDKRPAIVCEDVVDFNAAGLDAECADG